MRVGSVFGKIYMSVKAPATGKLQRRRRYLPSFNVAHAAVKRGQHTAPYLNRSSAGRAGGINDLPAGLRPPRLPFA